MTLRFSPSVFMAVFCCTYILVFAMDWPLFRYYPLNARLNWGFETLHGIGPGVAWYGLLASAGILATIASWLIPAGALDRGLRNRLWLFPLAAIFACVYLLLQFFR